MNTNQLKQLLEAARKATPHPVPADFADNILRAVRQEPTPRAARPFSIFEQLNILFPRLALAAAVVIVLCAIGNFMLPGTDDETVFADQALNLEDL